ncbi:hypothetical protein N431DRAFT_430339 [Stipitochalara longipes BDJ]|nr:hypothetical protein N431DRAFT_430339 [Stipitochalara longipes BDJ]
MPCKAMPCQALEAREASIQSIQSIQSIRSLLPSSHFGAARFGQVLIVHGVRTPRPPAFRASSSSPPLSYSSPALALLVLLASVGLLRLRLLSRPLRVRVWGD